MFAYICVSLFSFVHAGASKDMHKVFNTVLYIILFLHIYMYMGGPRKTFQEIVSNTSSYS